MKDRDEDALKALKRLRGEGNEMSAATEIELIRVSLREEIDRGTWADLFKGHNRRRTGVVLGVAFFFQATGQVFSGHYGAVFVKSLGTINPFTIQVSQSGINTFTSFVGILMLDRVGRRYVSLTAENNFVHDANLMCNKANVASRIRPLYGRANDHGWSRSRGCQAAELLLHRSGNSCHDVDLPTVLRRYHRSAVLHPPRGGSSVQTS